MSHEVLDSTNAEALALARPGRARPAVDHRRAADARAAAGAAGPGCRQPGNLFASCCSPIRRRPSIGRSSSFVAALAIHDAVAEVAPAITPAPRDQMAERSPARRREVRRHPDRGRGRRTAGAVAVGIGVNCASHPADTDYPGDRSCGRPARRSSPKRCSRRCRRKMLGRLAQWNRGRAFRHHPRRLAGACRRRSARLIRVRLADRELRRPVRGRSTTPGAWCCRCRKAALQDDRGRRCRCTARRPAHTIADGRPLMAEPGDELVFAPLGGVGEIGMNLALYGLGRRAPPAVDRGRSRRRLRRATTCRASISSCRTSAS